MKKTTLRSLALLPVIAAVFAGMVFLGYEIFADGGEWVKYHPLNAASSDEAEKLPSGNIYDRNGKVLLRSDGENTYYSDDRDIRVSTLHIVGDPQGNISTGARSLFEDMLTGYNFANGIYNLKAYGRGNDIYLTIDADACAAAYNALGNYKGAVGVYNYKTGEMLCSVSTPSYDVNDKPSDLLTNSRYSGVYVNRFFSAKYTPGSTFKIVTALSALENVSGIYNRTFTCRERIKYSTGTVICFKEGGHGTISFEKALNVSCNCAFAEISELVGKDALNATARELGFNRSFTINKIKTAASEFKLTSDAPSDIAWAGIGQYKFGACPAHMMMIAGAIANNGRGLVPYFLKQAVSPANVVTYSAPAASSSFSVNADKAAELHNLLRSNFENYYGNDRFPGYTMCGKTGTAEYEGQDDYSWFVGYSADEDAPYAVAVVAEQGGSGSGTAMNVANKALQALRKD